MARNSSGTDRSDVRADVGRTISRIAHQIIEKTALDGPDAPRVILLGIPTRGVTLAARLADKIKEFAGVTVRTARSTSRCTATTSTSSRRGHWRTPRSLRAASTIRWSSSSTTSSIPDARSALPWTRSATSAGPAPCNWRSSSTGVTASCRCAPTTSARTCPPRAARTSRCVSPKTMEPTASPSHRTEGLHDEASTVGR